MVLAWAEWVIAWVLADGRTVVGLAAEEVGMPERLLVDESPVWCRGEEDTKGPAAEPDRSSSKRTPQPKPPKVDC